MRLNAAEEIVMNRRILHLSMKVCLALCMLVAGQVPASDVNTELLDAAKFGDLKKVEACINNGGKVNTSDKETGVTPLIAASLAGHKEIVALLLEKGADVNASTPGGVTAIMAASLDKGNLEIAKLLLEKGAKINEKTKDGVTALKYSVFLDTEPQHPDGKSKGLVEKPVSNEMSDLLKKHGAQ
jgi:ankyrin repeat protein